MIKSDCYGYHLRTTSADTRPSRVTLRSMKMQITSPYYSTVKQLRGLLLLLVALIAAATQSAVAAPPPFALPARSEIMKLRSTRIETSKGDLYVELYPEDAPWHVANFKYLADKGFYSGLTFHVYQPGFIIQGGAPTRDPASGPGYSLPNEFSTRRHETGTLGMARFPDAVNPERNSHGSQFHLLLNDAPHMNRSYTVFGKVITGLDILERLRQGDKILSVKVYVRE